MTAGKQLSVNRRRTRERRQNMHARRFSAITNSREGAREGARQLWAPGRGAFSPMPCCAQLHKRQGDSPRLRSEWCRQLRARASAGIGVRTVPRTDCERERLPALCELHRRSHFRGDKSKRLQSVSRVSSFRAKWHYKTS